MPTLRKVPVEVLAEYGRLKESVRKAEEKGNFDTAHHTMLQRLLKTYPQLEKEVLDGEPTGEGHQG